MVNWQLSKQDSHWPYRGLICQLIEVTWFIWKLSAGQLIALLDGDQCSISYFLASFGAQLMMHTYWTLMLWSIDSCHIGYTGYPYPYQYHLSLSQAQMSTHRDQVFFEVIRWQVTSFQMIAGSSLIFLIHMKYVVFMCRTIKILISNWPRTRKFSQLLQAGKTVAFDFAHHGSLWSRSTSNFYTLIGQNLTLLLCQLIMYLTVFFHCMYKMKFSCYQESSVLHG